MSLCNLLYDVPFSLLISYYAYTCSSTITNLQIIDIIAMMINLLTTLNIKWLTKGAMGCWDIVIAVPLVGSVKLFQVT